ncbi:hypothetical protein CDCA_CDCA13G3692 [Cyanidium caldarium]|uniref:Uncharacterized protein n=1 Tax=Cyanidium caldarium TaxID=2771 RepID=A0AAV9IZD0_CYACA|nr:hypothetical protein CDCA_CDCA13G3692 [Cyanidium caldarium]
MRPEKGSSWVEQLRDRIHAFRLPIEDPRLRAAVTALYVVVPLAVGVGLLQWTGAEDRALEFQRMDDSERELILEAEERRYGHRVPHLEGDVRVAVPTAPSRAVRDGSERR